MGFQRFERYAIGILVQSSLDPRQDELSFVPPLLRDHHDYLFAVGGYH
jgi:hypothetical protein